MKSGGLHVLPRCSFHVPLSAWFMWACCGCFRKNTNVLQRRVKNRRMSLKGLTPGVTLYSCIITEASVHVLKFIVKIFYILYENNSIMTLKITVNWLTSFLIVKD